MAHTLKAVMLDPLTVKSGGETEVTITYRGETDQVVTLTAEQGFELSRTSVPLKASASDEEKKFPLTVTRTTATNKTCGITFQYVNSTRPKRVTVQ